MTISTFLFVPKWYAFMQIIFFPLLWALSIRPKLPVWNSGYSVWQIEEYFPVGAHVPSFDQMEIKVPLTMWIFLFRPSRTVEWNSIFWLFRFSRILFQEMSSPIFASQPTIFWNFWLNGKPLISGLAVLIGANSAHSTVLFSTAVNHLSGPQSQETEVHFNCFKLRSCPWVA